MFTGFQETEANGSGFEDGFDHTVRKLASDEITTYHPRTWKTNVRNLARQLHRRKIRTVAILSYSHGQAAAIDFAKLAPRYGITVALWLACDPVWRPSWAPRRILAQAFAAPLLWSEPDIIVPPSVRRAVYVRQFLDWPSGSKLVAKDSGKTFVEDRGFLTVGHTRIDEHPEWWAIVRAELETFCHPPKAIPVAE